MENNIDLVIAYRIYPLISKVPPVFSDDKLKLSELCLYSFKKALGNLKVKLFVILDNCPDDYVKLFKKYFNDDVLEIIRLSGIGNAGTFDKQMELLLNQDYSEYIYFAEDDYFYLDNAFPAMLEFLKNNNADFVSSYNHPDYYRMKVHRDFKSIDINFQDRNWLSIATTTLTFLTTKSKLRETKFEFDSYSRKNYDASIWLSLTKHKLVNPLSILKYLLFDKLWFKITMKSWLYNKKQIIFGKQYRLFIPSKTLSTHMDSNCLPDEIRWTEYFDGIIEKINFGS